MKRTILRYSGILGSMAAVLLAACYYDIEEELYPNGCDTTLITYTGDIFPLLDRSCLTCHNSLTQNGTVNLEGYENVKRQVDNGKLIGAISHDPGFSAMPQGGPQLSSCTIDKVQAWIDSGAPNN